MSLPGGRAFAYDSSVVFSFDRAPRGINTFTKESKIFRQTYYYANPIMYLFTELEQMANWCYDTFGPRGYNQSNMRTVWDHTSDPDYIFWFGEEKDLMMFLLRWQ